MSSNDESDHFFPMKGLELWKNKNNGFFVFQLHYSADDKKTPEYMERIRKALPRRQFMQEYELQWDSFAGLPVYEDYAEDVHGSKEGLGPHIGLPMLRGWDFGLTPACVVAQYEDGVLNILDEYVEVNMGADKFVPKVLSELKIRYPEWHDQKLHWKDYIDPSGFAKKDTDMTTCAQAMVDEGLCPYPGPVPFSVRRKGVTDFLITFKKGKPCFRLDLKRCPVLNRGFKGGYRYPEIMSEIESANPKPIKDEHSHPHDALQYICFGVKNIVNRQKKMGHIPKPEYLFNKSDGGDDKKDVISIGGWSFGKKG